MDDSMFGFKGGPEVEEPDRLARCHAACFRGIEGSATEVEVHVRSNTPHFDVVGLADTAGREARDRVRSAIVSSGYKFPQRRVVVNLAPADTPKSGAAHDLPMAIGILAAAGAVSQRSLRDVLIFGELALDGRLRPVRGAFLLASTAQARGLAAVLVPHGNGPEAALATNLPVFAPRTLTEAVLHLTGRRKLAAVLPAVGTAREPLTRDFVDARGHATVKRALVIAAAGGHNLLMVGPPGCGKTLLAERFPDLLPPLTTAEALEVSRLRSAAGLRIDSLPTRRPLRSPSCGASSAGVLGGGNPPRPGEISLAHRGVLFLDEMPHFRGDVLESLRQPLESGCVTISRAGHHVTFPAAFMLLAAMNPCPCGYAGTPRCDCTPHAVERYTRRLSGPLLDRIDLRVTMRAVKYEDLRPKTTSGLGTAAMRADVERAREIQRRRFGTRVRLNAGMTLPEMRTHCAIDAAGDRLLEESVSSGKLSARGVARVLRVARTIADLAGRERVEKQDLYVAMGWRLDGTAKPGAAT